MSVYLFMKRYAEEEMYRPHPALYRPRLSECSDYSGQYLHPDSWPPPQRRRSGSEVSSDISIQLNQTPLPPPPKSGGPSNPPSSSGPSSGASYHLPPASSSSSSSYPHTNHSQSLPMAMPPSAVPPPRYQAHMRMSASPC